MRAAWGWELGIFRESRLYPPSCSRVKDVDRVVVRDLLTTPEDYNFAIDKGGCMRATIWGKVAHDFGMCPLHCLYGK